MLAWSRSDDLWKRRSEALRNVWPATQVRRFLDIPVTSD
jgi:hypothetical protein